jgi:hypothetical protein
VLGRNEPDPADNVYAITQAEQAAVDAGLDELVSQYPGYTREEIEAIVTEPNGTIKPANIEEARAALAAEAQGIVPGPIRPAGNMRHDFVDGTGQTWDVKSLWSKYPYDLEKFLDKTVENDLGLGENILFNTEHMTEEDIVELENALQNDPRFEGRYQFVPPRPIVD